MVNFQELGKLSGSLVRTCRKLANSSKLTIRIVDLKFKHDFNQSYIKNFQWLTLIGGSSLQVVYHMPKKQSF